MERIIKPVYFTSRALKDLEKITRFNALLFGFKKAITITNDLIDSVEILENKNYDFSKIGSVDSEFKHLKRNYRKIFDGNYKITYREGVDKIYINRVFDTRQNPTKNK
ncbi:type II toxin-antitoxin system RelE/ParE family toxin [Flavobacterium sp.]|uniref:type II toxin-antitoxin system RelE/ParE family toxin n=1 Tax=Flavobacterium sp. TaxID=239 RepID=UPI0037C0DD57